MAGKLTAPTQEAISQDFVDRIPDLVALLEPAVTDVPRQERQWVFYGSQPIGQGQEGSDLDAFLLHNGSPHLAPHRRSAVWDARPVTIYVLSHSDLADDGLRRQFGGYFTLKLFGPFVTDRPGRDLSLSQHTARFLAPLSELLALGQPDASWSADQLLAHAHLAFLDLYPDAAGYLARLLRNPPLMARVWAHQRRTYLEALRTAGYISPTGTRGEWAYSGHTPVDDADRERARCTARFWAFGAVSHEADPSFPDVYFRKTDTHAAPHEQHAALAFLHGIAEGGEAP
ncbi:hypothetical protein GL263_02810 [Streptomyces durbertensis]|uniref:Nucleotidyltransferase n=1 Tax=Streptomyces durbertensis TaxID=2448886 RepID=A0ABR6EAZ7_9ACTN|nr:hypothetical protein [Streptomyces durbertensis]MBB1242506.1 hypothetical protein [Streptomyces durbertensis]